jgi:hypothetical protein
MTIKLIGADDAVSLGGEGGLLLMLFRFQAVATGNVSEIRVKGHGSGGHAKVGIYADSGGSPTSLLGYNNNNNATSSGWTTIILNTPVAVTAGTYYWLGIATNETDTIGYSSVTGGTLKYKTGWGFANMPDPAGSGFVNATDYGLIAGWGDTGAGAVGRSFAYIMG